MTRVLGIDTSLTGTGLCRADFTSDGLVLETVTVRAPGPTKDKSKRAMARRVNALIEQIESAIRPDDWNISTEPDPKPDLISMESLAYAAKGEGVWVLPWIFGRVVELAERYDIPLIVVGTSQLKKYVTGKGNADKETAMLAIVKRWPYAEATNNNEADAVALAAIGCRYIGMPIDDVPKDNQTIMAKVGP